VRIVRRLGTPLPGLTRKTGENRPYPPGQHAATARRRRSSDFAIRLREKQKLRFYFGLSEKQLRNYVRKARGTRVPPGERLLMTLESRLDNVVFRLGLAPTLPAARQLVTHGHILVDDARVSVPGQTIGPRTRVSVREYSRSHPLVVEGKESGPTLMLPSYLERDPDGFGGKMTARPTRADAGIDIDESLVVEYYA
jgi:small subunit ribosomal protein S4